MIRFLSTLMAVGAADPSSGISSYNACFFYTKRQYVEAGMDVVDNMESLPAEWLSFYPDGRVEQRQGSMIIAGTYELQDRWMLIFTLQGWPRRVFVLSDDEQWLRGMDEQVAYSRVS
ncbi:MAG: hypothetical protein KTR25_15575 [Myxococcales bacterium]|nr:hypothetical protein [Myxococcales bacterium]